MSSYGEIERQSSIVMLEYSIDSWELEGWSTSYEVHTFVREWTTIGAAITPGRAISVAVLVCTVHMRQPQTSGFRCYSYLLVLCSSSFGVCTRKSARCNSAALSFLLCPVGLRVAGCGLAGRAGAGRALIWGRRGSRLRRCRSPLAQEERNLDRSPQGQVLETRFDSKEQEERF